MRTSTVQIKTITVAAGIALAATNVPVGGYDLVTVAWDQSGTLAVNTPSIGFVDDNGLYWEIVTSALKNATSLFVFFGRAAGNVNTAGIASATIANMVSFAMVPTMIRIAIPLTAGISHAVAVFGSTYDG